MIDTASLTYTDKKTASGTKYYYTVRALNSDATVLSSYNTTGKAVTFLSVPVISEIRVTMTGINVKWGKVTGATGYKVYRKTSGGSWGVISTITSGGTLSYRDTAAKEGVMYLYCIQATAGTSTKSAMPSTVTSAKR